MMTMHEMNKLRDPTPLRTHAYIIIYVLSLASATYDDMIPNQIAGTIDPTTDQQVEK